MTNDGWGKEWPVILSQKHKDQIKEFKEAVVASITVPEGVFKEWAIHTADETPYIVLKEKVYNNLHPTHDPYTNPNAHIYYQCNCGAILDPGTKSFAALNNYASEAGWKVRWGETSYQPYCVECGKDVE